MKCNYQMIKYFIILFLVTTVIFSCKKEEIKPENMEIKDRIYSLMKDWYLWNDKLPAKVDLSWYKTPEETMDALMYKTLDKWSYVEKKATYDQYYEAGQTIGYGFGMKWDYNNNLCVSYVYTNSPAYREGIRRSWKILTVNGKSANSITDWNKELGEDISGIQCRFEFQDTLAAKKTITLTKGIINMNTVLYREVIQINGSFTGYLVFKGFIEPSVSELDEAFNYFQSKNIKDIIVDLRYNGGGRMNTMTYLASLLVPQSANGKMFYKYEHNSQQKEKNDKAVNFDKKNALNLSRIVFITSKSTASASETLINGLRPYISIVLIGNDTYGKPVGMYSWDHQDYVIVPISFRVVNSQGFSDFYSGIKADALRSDGLDKDFGNIGETCLKEAIYYLKNGSFSSGVTKKSSFQDFKNEQLQRKGLREEMDVF